MRERFRPSSSKSAFLEAGAVLGISIISLLVILLGTLLWGIWDGSIHPRLFRFLLDPAATMNADPLRTLLTIVVSIVIATIIAAIAGAVVGAGVFPKGEKLRRILNSDAAIRHHESGWSNIFTGYQGKNTEADLIVSVQLKSGNWLQGLLASYSPSPDDDPNRAIVLRQPLMYRTGTMKKAEKLDDVDLVTVLAVDIEYVGVTLYESGVFDV